MDLTGGRIAYVDGHYDLPSHSLVLSHRQGRLASNFSWTPVSKLELVDVAYPDSRVIPSVTMLENCSKASTRRRSPESRFCRLSGLQNSPR